MGKRTITIGIDTGTNTGFAVYNTQHRIFERIETLTIHQAIFEVRKYYDDPDTEIKKVRVEDARKRTWFGSADARQERSGAGIREGIGSVKRDAKIWEDFLTEFKIPFELVKPSAGGTKWNADTFKKSFGWSGRTTNHSRDAALLVAQ